jgi:Na+/H+-translocating membrane pyrophosphatase
VNTLHTCVAQLGYSFRHFAAAVVGDTVGDPFKDTSGPALNIVMKLMAVLSLVFADTFYAINNGSGLLNLS